MTAWCRSTVTLHPPDNGGCEIDFFVDFEFRSRWLQKIVGALFHETLSRKVAVFGRRATALFGWAQG